MDVRGELATLAAILERFRTDRLPRALDLKAKVDLGKPLDEFDMQFLDAVLSERDHVLRLISKHPEFEKTYVRVFSLYKEIVSQLKENEKNGGQEAHTVGF